MSTARKDDFNFDEWREDMFGSPSDFVQHKNIKTEKEVLKMHIQEFEKQLKDQLEKVENNIARLERAKSRLMEKLKNPEKAFQREEKKGTVDARRAKGEQVSKAKATSFKKKVEQTEIEDAIKEEKQEQQPKAENKSGFGFF